MPLTLCDLPIVLAPANRSFSNGAMRKEQSYE